MQAEETFAPTASWREATATMSAGLENAASYVDELQALIGSLVARADSAHDAETLRKAQMIDLLSQLLHRYASLVHHVSDRAPANIFWDEHSSSELRSILAAGRALRGEASQRGGECRLF